MSESSLGTATATFDLNITKFLSNADRAEEAMQQIDATSGGMFGSGNIAALEFADRLGEVGERIMGLGDRMYQSVTMPIMNFASGAYANASSLEQSYGKVNSVFSNSSDKIRTWASNAAEDFGLTEFAALQTVATYGAMFQAMGVAEEQAGFYSQELVGLAADMSAFNDVSTERTSIALRSALTGEYESMKQFGIVLKADAVEAEALKIAVADMRTEVTEADRVQARYNLIMEKTSLQHGQWEKEANGAAGSLAILRAKWGDLKTTLGIIFLPVATRVTSVLIKIVDAISRLPAPVQTAIVVIAGLAAAIGPLLIALGFVISSFASAIPLIIQFGPHVVKLASSIRNLSKAFTVLRTAMMALMAANPILLAITAIVVALGAAYATNFMGFRDWVNGMVSGLKDLLSPLQAVWDIWKAWRDEGDIEKKVNIGANFDGDKYTITETVLPDGTKVWNIVEDKTGKTFGQILESYTNYNGETFILVRPVDGGKAFWAKADLETGKPEEIPVPITGEPGAFIGAMTEITSATGNVVTVMIDGDGKPINGTIDKIIRDPNTGTKTIELTLANGERWIAEVDGVTGRIQLNRKITVSAETTKAQERLERLKEIVNDVLTWLEEFDTQFNAFMTHDWDTFDWRKTLDLLGLEAVIPVIETAIGLVEKLQGLSWSQDKPDETTTNEETGVSRRKMQPNPIGSGQLDRVISFGTGRNLGSMISGIIDLGKAGSVTGDILGGVFQQALITVDREMQKTASTTPMIGRGFLGASTDSKTASGEMQGAFGALSRSAAAETRSVSNSFATNMASANTQAVAQMLGMRVNSSLQMALMAADAKTQASNTSANMTGWTLGASLNLAVGMLTVVAAVRNSAGAMYSAGSYVGTQAGQGIYDGILSMLRQVRNAASAIINEATRAMRYAAQVASPSKITTWIGQMMGKGPVVGILSQIQDVRDAAARLSEAMIPAMPNMAYELGLDRMLYRELDNTPISGQTVINNYYDYSDHSTNTTASAEELSEIARGARKGAAVHNAMTDRNSASQYRKRGS